MSSVAATGKDTVIINNRILNDLADGNCFELTYDNDNVVVKTGKNGNSIYVLNETGREASGIIRVIAGSSDDKYLNGLFALQTQDLPSFPLMTGKVVKRIGDGLGNVTKVTYLVSGGVILKAPSHKTSVEGDVEAAIAIYNVKFSNAPRVIK